jgi:hypothetical protein
MFSQFVIYLVQLLWWTLGLNLLKFCRPGASQAVHACLFGMSVVSYILTIVVAVRQGGTGEDLFKSTMVIVCILRLLVLLSADHDSQGGLAILRCPVRGYMGRRLSREDLENYALLPDTFLLGYSLKNLTLTIIEIDQTRRGGGDVTWEAWVSLSLGCIVWSSDLMAMRSFVLRQS